MSKSLTNPSFDYSQLTKDERGKLIYFEGQLISSRKRVADEIIKHGEILHGAQQLLANHHNGVFVAWLARQGVSARSAYNAIDSFVAFGSFANLQNIEPSAMYILAKNDTARTTAKNLANRGIKITYAMAKELVSDDDSTSDSAPISEHVNNPSGGLNVENSTPSRPGGEDDPFDEFATEEFDAPFDEPDPPDSSTEAPHQEPTPEQPRKGTETLGGPDWGKCPNCAGTKWTEDDDGVSCAKCHHPHGEPPGNPDESGLEVWQENAEIHKRAVNDLNRIIREIKSIVEVPSGRYLQHAHVRICKACDDAKTPLFQLMPLSSTHTRMDEQRRKK